MRQFIKISLILLLVGCATPGIRSKNTSNLLKLKKGIDRTEVLKIMGTKTATTTETTPGFGYRISSTDIDIAVPNPYRSEIKKVGNKNYEIIFYYTDIRKQDGAITDDELTPLVFEDDKLIGWGWVFFEDIAQNDKNEPDRKKTKYRNTLISDRITGPVPDLLEKVPAGNIMQKDHMMRRLGSSPPRNKKIGRFGGQRRF